MDPYSSSSDPSPPSFLLSSPPPPPHSPPLPPPRHRLLAENFLRFSPTYATDSDLQERMWQMGIQPQQSMDGAAGPYPERPGEPDCVYYMRTGLCGFALNCRFNHPPIDRLGATSARSKEELPERIGQPDCQYFLKTGTCKFGAMCKYHHPREKAGSPGGQVQLNILGLPLRLGEKECAYYVRTGSCKFGVNCKFHHPQPGTVGTILPMSGSPLYTNGTPSSSGPAQYRAGIPSWSMARSPYLSGLRLPSPSSYMPVIVSPQAISMPGWSTYQGPISPMASPDGRHQGFGTGSVYSTGQHKTDLAAGVMRGTSMPSVGSRPSMLHLQVTHRDNGFPERPGQPDCHYYIKTGDCKFGASCKFHHPKDRATSPLPCTLSFIGLPLRPGLPPCTFYIRYGICKFGPTCKFDHPVGGLAYNTSPSSVFDMPVAPYAKVPSPVSIAPPLSSEMSREASKAREFIPAPQEPATEVSENGDSGVSSIAAAGAATASQPVENQEG